MKRKILIFTLLFSLCLTGCGGKSDSSSTNPKNDKVESNNSDENATELTDGISSLNYSDDYSMDYVYLADSSSVPELFGTKSTGYIDIHDIYDYVTDNKYSDGSVFSRDQNEYYITQSNEYVTTAMSKVELTDSEYHNLLTVTMASDYNYGDYEYYNKDYIEDAYVFNLYGFCGTYKTKLVIDEDYDNMLRLSSTYEDDANKVSYLIYNSDNTVTCINFDYNNLFDSKPDLDKDKLDDLMLNVAKSYKKSDSSIKLLASGLYDGNELIMNNKAETQDGKHCALSKDLSKMYVMSNDIVDLAPFTWLSGGIDENCYVTKYDDYECNSDSDELPDMDFHISTNEFSLYDGDIKSYELDGFGTVYYCMNYEESSWGIYFPNEFLSIDKITFDTPAKESEDKLLKFLDHFELEVVNL